jgi:hypothetical protein
MSTFYTSKILTDAVLAMIEDQYPTHIAALESASGLTLKAIETVKVGVDYLAKGLFKPFVLIDPRRMSIDDEGVGVVRGTAIYDIVIAYDGYSEEDATTAVQLYADAFVDMVMSDDYLNSTVDHASVTDIEYYPGGSGITRYAILGLELILDIER